MARDIARDVGLHFVYTGNVHDEAGQSTYCPGCGKRVIGRDWYEITAWRLRRGWPLQRLRHPLPGLFEQAPGTWGQRRLPIRISEKRTVDDALDVTCAIAVRPSFTKLYIQETQGNADLPGCEPVATPHGSQTRGVPTMTEQSNSAAAGSPEPIRPRRGRRWLFVTTVALVAALTGAMATRAARSVRAPGLGPHARWAGFMRGPLSPADVEDRVDRAACGMRLSRSSTPRLFCSSRRSCAPSPKPRSRTSCRCVIRRGPRASARRRC